MAGTRRSVQRSSAVTRTAYIVVYSVPFKDSPALSFHKKPPALERDQ